MTYPYFFVKLTFGGGVFDDTDIWSCGINFFDTSETGGDWGSTTLQPFAEQAAEAISAWFSNEDAYISSKAQLQWVKAAMIDTAGKYTPYQIGIYDFPTPINGHSTDLIPPQISTVLSFETNRTRGLAHAGRIYPPLSGTIGADGYIPDGTTSAMSEVGAQLIRSLNVTAESVFNEHVHAAILSKVGEGAFGIIDKVSVGNVLDTQRRRRDAFVETYTTTEL